MTIIDNKYAALGGSAGSLGSPIGPETVAPDGFGAFRQYQHGSIYATPATGAWALRTAVDTPYRAGGATGSPLGYPITDDGPTPDGSAQYAVFQHGALHVDGAGPRTITARRNQITASALPVVATGATGIHVSWLGPAAWLYSARGYWVQRRPAPQSADKYDQCVVLADAALTAARTSGEASTGLGAVQVRSALWPYGAGTPPPCDAITLELASPYDAVDIALTGGTPDGFAFGLRCGKVVAGPLHGVHVTLRGQALDTVVVYARDTKSITWCVRTAAALAADEASWDRVPYVAAQLQLPLKAIDPTITDELALAAARLPAGAISPGDFANLAGPLDRSLPQLAGPRPIDQIAAWRDDAAAGGGMEESTALDPLRVAVLHPTWRRALGMAMFDQSGLVTGASYQYRVTGVFPVEDLEDAVYSVHTVPTGTQLPAQFWLRDLRVALAQPSHIVRVVTGPTSTGCRRGIAFAPWTGAFWWYGDFGDALTGASAALDFPAPVSAVIVEVAAAAGVSYAGAAGGTALGPPQALPGARARLSFAAPIDQLRLYGAGTLFQIRVPGAERGLVPVTVTLPPVALVDTPIPPPPASLTVVNLQVASSPSSGPPPEVPPARHLLGFEVRWPPPAAGDAWPTGEPAAQPLTATMFQLQHREGTGAWEDVIDGDHWLFGARPGAPPDPVALGCDLLAIFPEQRPPAPAPYLSWRDAFSADLSPAHPPRRPAPVPGTSHSYRIRSIDTVGRASPTWTVSDPVTLEKHVPPPVPAAWDGGSWTYHGDVLDKRDPGRPTGVFAQILQSASPSYAADVAAAVDLSAAERAALLAHTGNAIILRWGWHDMERQVDKYAKEFRLYGSPPLDVVTGSLVAWDPLPTGWRLHLTLDRALAADAAAGAYLEAGYAFRITTHTAGTTITADVAPALRNADGTLPTPVAGAIRLPLRFSPAMTRPPAWAERMADVVPIVDAQDQYHYIFYDRLDLSDAHPRDAVWVGVSSADREDYVPDQRTAAPIRKGNESAIVVATCAAHHAGRPVLAYTPPLGPVPEVVAPEPAGRPVTFDLDCVSPLPAGTLAATDFVIAERVAAGDVIGAFAPGPGGTLRTRTLQPRSGEPLDAPFAAFDALAAVDRAAILAGYAGSDVEALDARYLVWLAARHPYADRLFKPSEVGRVPAAAFHERLPGTGGRWIYRLRKAAAGGALSAGAAYPPLVVRVPSRAPGAPPEKESVTPGTGAVTLRLRAAAGLSHLLVFSRPLASPIAQPAVASELLRVPNRPDLAGQLERMVMLRTSAGLLPPRVKSLADADVESPGDGFLRADIAVTGAAGQVVQVWACSLTRDRVPSRVVGPFRLTIPGGA